MANFRTHLTVAATADVIATAVVMQTLPISPMQGLLLFLLGLQAGLLPDIDSDHSIPARWLFTMLSIATAVAVVFQYHATLALFDLMLLALFAALLVRFALLPLFAATTEHRGLFHSLPMALLLGIITLHAGFALLDWQSGYAWLGAVFVSGGYLLHLLLDELYSVNFIGMSIKGSFGTALTLFSREAWFSYTLLYAAVGCGFWLAPPTLGFL